MCALQKSLSVHAPTCDEIGCRPIEYDLADLRGFRMPSRSKIICHMEERGTILVSAVAFVSFVEF